MWKIRGKCFLSTFSTYPHLLLNQLRIHCTFSQMKSFVGCVLTAESSQWADKHWQWSLFYQVLCNHLNSLSVTLPGGLAQRSQRKSVGFVPTRRRNLIFSQNVRKGRNKACSVIFETSLLWEDLFLMFHFLSFKRGGFFFFLLPCSKWPRIRKNRVEGEGALSVFSLALWPSVHSFIHSFNKCLWCKLSWALRSWGHKAGQVLALLELVSIVGRPAGRVKPGRCSQSLVLTSTSGGLRGLITPCGQAAKTGAVGMASARSLGSS